jgi:acetylornithine deacetylase
MACTVNEEHGYTGALALEKLWKEPGGLIPRRPDAAIVAEPTLLDVVVAHKGTVRWRCHTTGRAAHSSQPHLGDNAIFKMSRVLPALQRYQRDVAPHLGEHPLCGRPSLSVGTIHGGLSVNTVPDRCTIEIDRRLLPGEEPRHAYEAVLRFLADDPAIDFAPEHEAPFMQARGLPDDANHPLAERLLAAIEPVVGRRKKIGVPYGTDAATYHAMGIPSVVFGPGSIDQAHTADEWVAIEQLEAAVEAYYRMGESVGV